MPRMPKVCKAAASEDYAPLMQLIERGQLQCEMSSTEGAVYFVPPGFEPDPSIWDPILASLNTPTDQAVLLLLANGDLRFRLQDDQGRRTVQWCRR